MFVLVIIFECQTVKAFNYVLHCWLWVSDYHTCGSPLLTSLLFPLFKIMNEKYNSINFPQNSASHTFKDAPIALRPDQTYLFRSLFL